MIRRILILSGALLAAALLCAASDPLLIAQRQFEAGSYREATATLQSALAQEPGNAGLHYWLARCYYELGAYDLAISSAEQAVKLDPKNSEYHQWLGRAYGGKAEKVGGLSGFSLARKVRREFEEAVHLNPANLRARRDLLEFYLNAPGLVGGDKDKALQHAQAIAALDPVEGHLARAAYWLGKKKPELAEAEYRRVLEEKPGRVEPYLEVADFYQQREDASRMEAAVEPAARVNPSHRALAYYRGVVRVLAGKRLSEAEQLLKSYLTGPPRSDRPSPASTREWLGRLYERLGKQKEAAGEYRAALQLDPNLKSARDALRRVEKQL